MKYFDNPIPELHAILKHMHPGEDFKCRDDSDGHGPFPTRGSPPTEAELLAAEPAAMAARRKTQLTEYAEEQGLRKGAQIKDPVTGRPVADSTAPLDEIRQDSGRSRVKAIKLDRRGTPAQKAAARAARIAEENVAEAVYDTSVDVAAGTITTEAQINAVLAAIVLN